MSKFTPTLLARAYLSAEISDFGTSISAAWPCQQRRPRMYRLRCRRTFLRTCVRETSMSYSISASKAKATHDMAMSIIETEARERALRTQRLREQRLAREAQVEV